MKKKWVSEKKKKFQTVEGKLVEELNTVNNSIIQI